MAAIEQFSAAKMGGEPVSLGSHAWQVRLIVNTGSKCGFNPQNAAVETFYDELGPRGLALLGFREISSVGRNPEAPPRSPVFCVLTYDVAFDVRHGQGQWPGTHQLFAFHGGLSPPATTLIKLVSWLVP